MISAFGIKASFSRLSARHVFIKKFKRTHEMSRYKSTSAKRSSFGEFHVAIKSNLKDT